MALTIAVTKSKQETFSVKKKKKDLLIKYDKHYVFYS